MFIKDPALPGTGRARGGVRWGSLIGAGIVFLASAWLSPSLPAAEPPLILGVFPRHNAVDTVRMFSPMAGHLSRRLKREVRIETAKDFESFWKGVLEQRYDVVHYNQLHYIRSRRQAGYEVILKNEEFGASTIAAVIVARKDRGIRSLQDLKGKKIVFGGDKTAMMAYIQPTLLLREAGLREQDYVEDFAKNPPNALMAAYYKQADAAAVGDVIFQMPVVTQRIDVMQMTVLATGAPMAHLPWAVKKGMPARQRREIQSALADLKNSAAGREILKSAQFTGLVVATDDEYDLHRRVLREILGEQD
jgi:phosphonate transport system substrate-binding protein